MLQNSLLLMGFIDQQFIYVAIVGTLQDKMPSSQGSSLRLPINITAPIKARDVTVKENEAFSTYGK